MNSSPRRWVLKPLSPLLQPSDLRSIAGPAQDDNLGYSLDSVSVSRSVSSVLVSPQQAVEWGDVVVRARQVAMSQDSENTSNEWQPSSPSSPSSPGSSTDSHCGFYSFVEDPASLEAELNEEWMVSPQRMAQLETLKEEQDFKLQTYTSNRKPESLFSDNNDLQYKLDPNNHMEVVRDEEEKQLRQDIIRSQAPKKNTRLTEQLSVLQDLDLSRSTNKLIEGLSVSFSPISNKPEPCSPTEPGAVDKEQINFSAARQQFLKLEQDRLNNPLPQRSSKTNLNSSLQSDTDVSSCRQAEKGNQVVTGGQMELGEDTTMFKKLDEGETFTQRSVTVCQADDSLSILDDLDSGLEALGKVSANYTSHEGVFSDITHQDCKYETPIEREIRLVQEREENLRRLRGLKLSDGHSEMIQIRTKRLQTPPPSGRVRDKKRVSFITQKNIQRRKDPQQQYRGHRDSPQQEDGGHRDPPQQEDRSHSDLPQQPVDMKTEFDLQNEDRTTEDRPFSFCPHRHLEDTELCISPISAASSSCRESEVRDQTTSSFSHFSSPKQDLTLTLPRSWRENLESTGLQSRGNGAPDFIEKEIKEDLRREQELRELRESRTEIPSPLVEPATKMPVSQFYPPANTDKVESSLSSSPRPTTRLPSVSLFTAQLWTSSSPTGVQSSTTPFRGLVETLLQGFEERRARLKLEESSYAGIQPVDDVNNEVVESTRVIRHKNQRALRWEAGVFANQVGQ
ncbi:hypothetical protein PAMP_024055 [Pampus punctatissimus]